MGVGPLPPAPKDLPRCGLPAPQGPRAGRYLAPDGQVARLLHDLLQLLVNLNAGGTRSRRWWTGDPGRAEATPAPYTPGFPQIKPPSSDTRLPTPPLASGPTQTAHLSMLRGVNKVGGSPSMWRGRAGGVGCCGELSEDGERLPPSLASGSCKAGGVRTRGGEGVSSQLAPAPGLAFWGA